MRSVTAGRRRGAPAGRGSEMDRAVAEDAPDGDEALSGRVVAVRSHQPAAARSGPETEAAPKPPGVLRLMWRQHGPHVRPYLWIPALWADADLAYRIPAPGGR